ncbi:hypothetical protein EMN47_06535 [Prolixibacteraceae bacterium JC049]|nr:hypothetical protein [Prolixibacteraceae bacterium JC049]
MIRLFILVISMCIATSTTVLAQKQSPEERAKKELAWMTKELKLNETQVKKVEAISKTFNTKMKDLRKSGDRSQMRDAFMKMRDDRNKELQKVLTEDQYKKYQTLLKERRKNRKGGKKRRK